MKYKSLFKLIFLGFICIFLAASCTKEGPMGLPGADGTDGENGTDGTNGVDGEVTCLVCHSGDNILDKKAQFAYSGHYLGEFLNSREEWSSSCVACHVPVGFVQYAETGQVIGAVENASPWECSTCHGLHQTFESTDYALRMSGAVDVIGTSIDLENTSNLCINCHKPRRGWQDYDDSSHPDSVMVTSSHAGPHHGPQGSVMMGIGGDHRIGSIDVSAFGPNTHGTDKEKATCVGCHMYNTVDDKSEGGHTYWPAVEACQQCHESATDFDYHGVQSQVDALMEELAELLEAQEGQKIAESAPRKGDWKVVPGTVHGIIHFDEEDGAYHPVVGQFDRSVYSAFWNFITVLEDRSHGIHNPAYVKALLHNSIEGLQ